MAEEIAFENERISNFQGLVTLTLDGVILHTVMNHSSTSTYMLNFTEIEKTFCWRTGVRTDAHLRPALFLKTKARFGRLPVRNLCHSGSLPRQVVDGNRPTEVWGPVKNEEDIWLWWNHYFLPNQACWSPCTSIASPKSANLTAAPFILLASSRFSGCQTPRTQLPLYYLYSINQSTGGDGHRGVWKYHNHV